MDERAKDILRRAGYQVPEEREHGDRVREAAEKVKEYYIQDMVEEGFSPEQARKEVEEEWDWESIISGFKENIYGMWPCEQTPKFVESLEIVRKKDPTLHEKLRGRCFVLSPDFYPTTTAAPGVAVPIFINKERMMAIVISGAHAEEFTPQALARTLAHEAMHIDMDENPEKYGIKSSSWYFVMKMLGETDTVISKRLEEMDLEKYRAEIGPANHAAWRKARYKIWPEDAVFMMTAYLKGRPSPPRWEG